MADRQRTERIRIPLPDGFDPARHKTSLEQLIATEFGDGFEIDHIDPSAGAHGEAIAVRSVTLTEVMDQESTGRREVRLAKGTKPADGDRVAARFADQYPGEQMIEFQPFLGYAVVAPLDPATSRCRNAVAGALGAKPWDIKIDKRSDGGFDLQLPETYMPSRHDSKLQEIAEAVVGSLGWTIDTDPATARVAIVPGEPPSFPPVIRYPFSQPFVRYDAGPAWARIPLGMQLGSGPDPTDEFYLDLEAAPHSMVSGTSGGGKSVIINSLIAGVLARGSELVVVDLPAKAVDFIWCKQFVRPGGWGCDNLKDSVTSLALVYEEGQRRAALLAQHGVTKWTDLPSAFGLRPIVVIIDEVTGLFMPEEVPKGLPKDHELVTGPQEVNMLKATLRSYIAKLSAELRFVGVKVLVSSQVSSTATGVPTAIRLNLGNKLLLGTKPTDNNRRVSLSDPTSVPKVPGNIQTDAAAGRGVGVAEPEGQEPCVFKGYFASTDQFAQWLESLGTPTTDRPSPTSAEVALHTPTLADGGGATAASAGRDGGWGEVHVADGGGAASVSAAFAPTEMCPTCGGPIDPLTGACHCTR